MMAQEVRGNFQTVRDCWCLGEMDEACLSCVSAYERFKRKYTVTIELLNAF